MHTSSLLILLFFCFVVLFWRTSTQEWKYKLIVRMNHRVNVVLPWKTTVSVWQLVTHIHILTGFGINGMTTWLHITLTPQVHFHYFNEVGIKDPNSCHMDKCYYRVHCSLEWLYLAVHYPQSQTEPSQTAVTQSNSFLTVITSSWKAGCGPATPSIADVCALLYL